jgi:hypothetical protein
MFTTGGTGGGPGAPTFNLSAAQFQQRVATAEIECRRCNKGCKGKKFCKRLVQCKFCPAEFAAAQAARRGCCDPAKEDLSSCSSRSCSKSCSCVIPHSHSSSSCKSSKKSSKSSKKA